MAPPVLQDLSELQLCDWRNCVSQDRLMPCVLRAAAAPNHLPHLLRSAHRLRLPQPALHDGPTVSDISEPLAAASTPSLSLTFQPVSYSESLLPQLALRVLTATYKCLMVRRKDSRYTDGRSFLSQEELLVGKPCSCP